MTINFSVKCDRDECTSFVQTSFESRAPQQWLTLTGHEDPPGIRLPRHFCSIYCLYRWSDEQKAIRDAKKCGWPVPKPEGEV